MIRQLFFGLIALLPLAGAGPASAAPGPAASPRDPTALWLDGQCRLHGADPLNPWALAHAVEVYGKGFKTSDGRVAIDVMVNDFLERRGDGGWGFPVNRGGVPVEPHKSHQVMTLVRAGVPASQPFLPKQGDAAAPVTLGQLLEQLRQDLPGEGAELARNEAWTLDALAAVTSARTAKWKNRAGAEVDFNLAMDRAVTWVDEQHRFLNEARLAGEAKVAKRKQFIWSLPCGGFHHIQAAWSWADPAFIARHKAEAVRLAEVLLYRLDAEHLVYEEALAQAPQYRLQLNVQKLKFFGHWLETVARLKAGGLWPRTKPAQAAVLVARARLADSVAALRDDKVSERMGELKGSMPQVYLDLIGDSCHALGGWRATAGK